MGRGLALRGPAPRERLATPHGLGSPRALSEGQERGGASAEQQPRLGPPTGRPPARSVALSGHLSRFQPVTSRWESVTQLPRFPELEDSV